MLLSLRIENFALVDHLVLDLRGGLTVLTGETGAGKSIILDAIDAVLGGKVSGRMVRTGEEKSLLEATFCLTDDLRAWLAQQAIAPPPDPPAPPSATQAVLTCTREIIVNASGQRSRSRVNGVLVNKQQMEDLRDRLVEITAQGQTVQIGQPALQRDWLDSYGGDPVHQQRTVVATAHAAYQQAFQALERRRQLEQNRQQQIELYEFQLKELTTAQLDDADELEQLENEQNRLTHSVTLQQQSYQIYQALYQNDNGDACADLLGQAEGTLQAMLHYDSDLQPILDSLSQALQLVQEAGRAINTYGETIEADPQRLEDVQERIRTLKSINRKYGPTLAEAIALRDRLQAELATLTDEGQSLEELTATSQRCQRSLIAACAHLSQLRQAAATDLEARIVAELKPLAMAKVQFQVDLAPCPPSSLGADQVTYLFSPNPGEPLQPLTQIASGGEMSRFLLALQAVFSQVDGVGTLIFDEIDTGVSGRVTQAIADKLVELSHRHQVLCVTHQAIVAAMADQHWRVSKHVVAGADVLEQGAAEAGTSERTVVRVMALTAEDRREELAQLAGGHSAQAAIAFADSLLAKAATQRGSEASAPAPLAKAPTSNAPEEPPADSEMPAAGPASFQIDSPPKAAKRSRKATRSAQSAG
jgi:DNA repair protein RecN (Recombination protein N)